MSDEKKRLAELDKQAESSAPGSSSTLLDLPPSHEPQSAPRASQDDNLQAPEDFPILVIDDCRIYSAYAPTRTLYRLSNPVCDATRTVYGIEKFRYKVDNSSDDPKVRHTVDHIYDFERDIQLGALPTVHIKGFTSSKRTYKSAIISDATKIGRGYKVEDEKAEGKDNEEILKTERPFKDLLNQGRGNTIEWKDATGRVLAVETKLQRDEDKKIVEPPRLTIKANMDEKLYDFLVTSWCAVVWKEAKGDLKEPLTWEKFKDRASRMSNRGSAALWPGF